MIGRRTASLPSDPSENHLFHATPLVLSLLLLAGSLGDGHGSGETFRFRLISFSTLQFGLYRLKLVLFQRKNDF
jgi:hypothetical protein